MIPDLEFYKPAELKDALALLHEAVNKKANSRLVKPIAGGTDILPGFHQGSSRFMKITGLVDITGIAGLKKIEKQDDHLHLGAGLTFSEIELNREINNGFPLLSKAAATIGSRQIRNRATIAGNFVNNAPCADSITPLLVYNARVVIQSARERRELSLEDFLVKPYQTRLQADELITGILLPIVPENYRGDFYKLGRRRAVAISRITLAVLGQVENNTFRDLRIASGAITPVGKRFPRLEKAVYGEKVSEQLFKSVARELGSRILEITGLRWSTPHKLPVVQQALYQLLCKTFLKE